MRVVVFGELLRAQEHRQDLVCVPEQAGAPVTGAPEANSFCDDSSKLLRDILRHRQKEGLRRGHIRSCRWRIVGTLSGLLWLFLPSWDLELATLNKSSAALIQRTVDLYRIVAGRANDLHRLGRHCARTELAENRSCLEPHQQRPTLHTHLVVARDPNA